MKSIKIAVAVFCVAGLLPVTAVRAAEANMDVPINSAYVWRGQVLNNEHVLQPSLTVSADNGLSFNTWASYNLSDSLGDDLENQFSEVDLTASYALPVEVVDLSISVAEYLYPHQTVEDEEGNSSAAPSSREVYITVGKEDMILSPSISLYYDFKEVKAYYAMASIGQGFELNEQLSFDLTLSIGAADSDYNQYYFGVDDAALNDGNAKASASFAFSESLSLNGYMMYSCLLDSEIRDSAKENPAFFKKGDCVSGGVSLGYSF